jgi:uncharacterized membrane protein YphA (DoxX/SURF4 family)
VFLASGTSKLRRFQRFGATLTDLRLPRAAIGPLAVAVPAWEIATGVVLVAGWAPWVGAASTALLAGTFIGSAALAARTGQEVSCSCFGRESETLGRATIVRAFMLLALAVAVAVPATFGDGGWRPESEGDWLAAGLGGLGRVTLGRYVIVAMLVEDAVATGSPLPHVECRRLTDGQPCLLADATGREAVVVQLTTTCATCRTVARDLSDFARAVARTIRIVVIVRDAPMEVVERFVEATGLDGSLVLIDETAAVGKATGLSWTPAAMSVRRGRLGEAAIVNDARQLETFTDRTIAADVEPGQVGTL